MGAGGKRMLGIIDHAEIHIRHALTDRQLHRIDRAVAVGLGLEDLSPVGEVHDHLGLVVAHIVVHIHEDQRERIREADVLLAESLHHLLRLDLASLLLGHSLDHIRELPLHLLRQLVAED